jgi:hypothetical protein
MALLLIFTMMIFIGYGCEPEQPVQPGQPGCGDSQPQDDTNDTAEVVAAINVGSDRIDTYKGEYYDVDIYFDGGTANSTSDTIIGAEESTVYQTERYGDYTYEIPMDNGDYHVELGLVEMHLNQPDSRLVNITVEGASALNDADIYQQKGHDVAYDPAPVNVMVKDGSLTIHVSASKSNGTLSRILVLAGHTDDTEPEPDDPDVTGFFSWDVESSPVGELYNGTPDQPFDDVNRYAGIITDIVDTVPGSACHSGTRCIRLGYPGNEAGVELQVRDLLARTGEETKSLFIRKYEYYGDEWQTNWPVGLKTSRCFTDVSGRGAAYMSEKLIYQTYGGDADDLYERGMNNAIGDLDLKAAYDPNQEFGNGLPYIRTGHWYKYETWMVLDSAVDANDGVLQVWIDDVLVYNNTSVPWRSTERGVTRGGNYWAHMWFGGNYSGATFGAPTETLYRYIDDLYLSTTLDR